VNFLDKNCIKVISKLVLSASAVHCSGILTQTQLKQIFFFAYLDCILEFFDGDEVPEGGLEVAELLEASVELMLDFANNFSAHLRHATAKSRFSVGFNTLLISSCLATEVSK
jgi:hypothetical protein